MASGKSRTTKRSSGSSPTTIFICIALTLLLLWLLTSNTFAPATTHSTSRAAMKSPMPIKPLSRSHHSDKPSETHHEALTHEAHHVDHEDIPTHIPDAVAIGDNAHSKDAHDDKADLSSNDVDAEPKADDNNASNDEVEPTKTDDDNASSNNVDVEPKIDDSASNINNDVEPIKPDDTASNNDVEEPKTDESTSNDDAVPKIDDNTSNDDTSEPKTVDDPIVKTEETAVEVEEEQQTKAKSNPTSEESSTAQEQETKQTNAEEESQQSNPEDEKHSSETSNHDEITEEDNQQRIESHQKQEDEQIQTQKHELHSRDTHGAISHDQVAHNKASGDDATAQAGNGDGREKPKESSKKKKAWSTQADHSDHEKERRKSSGSTDDKSSTGEYTWRLCNVTAGADYIPCLDNEKAIAKLHSRRHHEHRERHCPEDAPTCLVPMPKGYKTRIDWPQSRDKIWYHNVPHTMLAEVKGHQNWVKVTGEFLTFPGGGTQFIHGALHYIDFVQEAVPDIAWGKHTRVVLDVGCGVASLGGYLFERDVIAMSFAPKDEHEAQVQMALERGIPAISAVMGSQRLPFPSRVFDIVHCARCRVPWHADGGALLLELNRVLRPGGYFVWSATPVYQKLEEDVQIWNEMSNLTVAMCWELVTIKKDTLNSIGAAIYQKPDTNDCYQQRKQNEPPMCKSDDDPNAAWYIPLQSCMHSIPLQENERGSQWPEEWPDRLQTPPYWMNKTEVGIYGKAAPDDFASDYKHWKKMVSELYMEGLGVSWSHVRNVMDMRAVYGGFAAALKDLKVWVMNVVNVDSPDTLPLIYERGLFGIYHDWCESFSTYPRTYDLLHADHLFSTLKKRCNMVMVMAEIDRIVRPGGILIVRDDSGTIAEIDEFLKSMHWEVHFPKSQEGILAAQKSEWRPESYADQS